MIKYKLKYKKDGNGDYKEELKKMVEDFNYEEFKQEEMKQFDRCTKPLPITNDKIDMLKVKYIENKNN